MPAFFCSGMFIMFVCCLVVAIVFLVNVVHFIKKWRIEFFICAAIAIIAISFMVYETKNIFKYEIAMFNARKPMCMTNDISCLERKVNWYKDSIKYSSIINCNWFKNKQIDSAKVIDSLTNELNNIKGR